MDKAILYIPMSAAKNIVDARLSGRSYIQIFKDQIISSRPIIDQIPDAAAVQNGLVPASICPIGDVAPRGRTGG